MIEEVGPALSISGAAGRHAASTDSSTCRNDGRPQRGSGGQ